MGEVRESVRVWILAVALGSFAAGMVAGLTLPEMIAADRAPQTPEQQYARDLAERYGLTSQQQRSLALVLRNDREQQLEILSSADWSQLPAALRSRRLAGQRLTEQRIRALLDEHQRLKYDRDSRPVGAPGGVVPDTGPGSPNPSSSDPSSLRPATGRSENR